MGTVIDVGKMKPSYTNKQKAGIIQNIMQLDKEEKLSSDKDYIISLNEDSQRGLIDSVFNEL
jgi:hypothetical protein